EIAQELKEKVTNVVKKQLVSDKPLGVYLSGGIDSSIIVDRVSSLRTNVETFSVGFDLTEEEEREKFNVDFELAKRTSRYYGTHHHEILLSPQDVVDNFEKAVWHMDEPISNPTAMSMIVLAHFAKENVDVVLGGDGGDELFGGYPRYRHCKRIEMYQTYAPKALRDMFANMHPLLKKINTDSSVERMALFMFQKDVVSEVVQDEYIKPNITKDFFQNTFFQYTTNKTFAQDYMNVDRQSWLRDFSLMLTDKMTMSAALEARVPLLDADLIEFAETIPMKYKTSIFDTKIILKEAFKNDLPDFVLGQPKRGWVSPGAKWLRRKDVQKMAQEILNPGYYEETQGLFKWEEIEKMLEEHISKKRYNLTMIWALMTFQVWAKKYKVTV
ncbi:MAG: asparagine synthase, partial [Candidatus Pacebacteria bacterium]|nr:asparagine synthase [Candidatus Paceibacterota bacterium]